MITEKNYGLWILTTYGGRRSYEEVLDVVGSVQKTGYRHEQKGIFFMGWSSFKIGFNLSGMLYIISKASSFHIILKKAHRKWVEESSNKSRHAREGKWTQSIAMGSKLKHDIIRLDFAEQRWMTDFKETGSMCAVVSGLF